MKKYFAILIFLLSVHAEATSIVCDNINEALSNEVEFSPDKYSNQLQFRVKLPKQYMGLNADAFVVYYIPDIYKRLLLPQPKSELDPAYPEEFPKDIILTSHSAVQIKNNTLSFPLSGNSVIGLEAKIYINFSKGKNNEVFCGGKIYAHYKFGSQ